jgi:hypothetical protein
MTWIGIFPLVYIFATLLGLILPPDFPIFLRLALVTGLVVPAMSYVVGRRSHGCFTNGCTRPDVAMRSAGVLGVHASDVPSAAGDGAGRDELHD